MPLLHTASLRSGSWCGISGHSGAPRHIAAAGLKIPRHTSSQALHRSAPSVQAVSLEELIEEVDVVEYTTTPKTTGAGGAQKQGQSSSNGQGTAPGVSTRLGRVMKVVVPSGLVLMEPLVEEEAGVFVADDDANTEQVEATAVLRVVDYELSQRQDKVSNPHGEHAHDVYTILKPWSGGTYKGSV